MHVLIFLIFPGTAKTDLRWGWELIGHLMASCVRNLYRSIIR